MAKHIELNKKSIINYTLTANYYISGSIEVEANLQLTEKEKHDIVLACFFRDRDYGNKFKILKARQSTPEFDDVTIITK